MTPRVDAGPGSVAGRWLAVYRLQARLMWEWRPTRLAILRRAILSYLGACLALAITAGVAPGLQVDGLGPLLLAALLLLALDSTLAVVLHGLLVGLPIFVAQVWRGSPSSRRSCSSGGSCRGSTWATPRQRSGEPCSDAAQQPVRGARGGERRRLLLQRARPATGGTRVPAPDEPDPGLLVVQVDGLSLPVAPRAIRAGRAPVLGRLVRSGESTLHPWIAMLPPTTPASQAGILHGNNEGSPAFAGTRSRAPG